MFPFTPVKPPNMGDISQVASAGATVVVAGAGAAVRLHARPLERVRAQESLGAADHREPGEASGPYLTCLGTSRACFHRLAGRLGAFGAGAAAHLGF